MISSPFLRCLQTAMCVAGVFDFQSVGLSNGLCELLSPSCDVTHDPILPIPDLESHNVALNDSSLHLPLPDYPEQMFSAYRR